ncbi:MAG: bZIP transcription factor, partial [Planctomycetota bacterium]
QLFFGPTDDCSLGIDAASPGLQLRDPNGIRILSPNPATFPELFFGPTDDCSLGIDAALPGLLLRDPAGIRILSPNPATFPQLLFGPTDDCSIGIDPAQPGLQLRDPSGVRILSFSIDPSRLFFGPTDDCSISAAAPGAAPGMTFSDPSGFFFQGGPVFATAFVPTSSERFKENVRPIEHALETLLALNGVRFEWKDRLGGKTDIGFVAENVARVVPEVVACDADGAALGLSYDNLVALTVEGIKEQQLLIDGLKAERRTLEGEVAVLKAQNETLAERLARLETLVGTLSAQDK